MLVSVYNIKNSGKSVLDSFYDLYIYFGSNIPMYMNLTNQPDQFGSDMNVDLSNDIISNNQLAQYLVCVDSTTNVADICQKFNYICNPLVEINIDPSNYNNTYQIVSFESEGLTSYKLDKL